MRVFQRQYWLFGTVFFVACSASPEVATGQARSLGTASLPTSNAVSLPASTQETAQPQSIAAFPAERPLPPGWRENEKPLRYVFANLVKPNFNQKMTIYTKPGGGAMFAEAMPGARLPIFEESPAKGGCKDSWLRVQYSGWICSTGTKEAPAEVEEEELHLENRTPTQAAITKRATLVYKNPWVEAKGFALENKKVTVERIVDVEGESYAQLGPNMYLPAEDLAYLGRDSFITSFSGVDFSINSKTPYVFFIVDMSVFAEPTADKKAKPIAEKKRYEHGVVLEQQQLGKKQYLRIAEGWVELKKGVSLVEPDPRPQNLGQSDRWVLIDLSDQLLEAYEGDQLFFATLVSSGKRSNTVKGTFGLTRKYRYRTMAGGTGKGAYRVINVPWAQYFHEAYALHGAFWHDKFGTPASHGCVNLAPIDAMKLAQFVEPILPNGWWSIYPPAGNVPTSTVIVRE